MWFLFFIQCTLLNIDPLASSTNICSAAEGEPAFCRLEFSLKPDGDRQPGWPWLHPHPVSARLSPTRQRALNVKSQLDIFNKCQNVWPFHCRVCHSTGRNRLKVIGSPEFVNNVPFTESCKRGANNDAITSSLFMNYENSNRLLTTLQISLQN